VRATIPFASFTDRQLLTIATGGCRGGGCN